MSLSEAKNEKGEIDWKKFFEGSSRYKQIYNLEIIEELMQDGSAMEGDKRVAQVDNKQAKPAAESADGNETTASSAADANAAGNAEQQQLLKARQNWTKMFLEQGGFTYILTLFGAMTSSKDANSLNDDFALKNLSFILILLRVFMTAAFSTAQNTQISEAVELVRKHSNVSEGKAEREAAKESDTSLNRLMLEKFGADILNNTDFTRL